MQDPSDGPDALSKQGQHPSPTAAAFPWYNFAATRPTLNAVWLDVCATLEAAGVRGIPTSLDHETPYRTLAAVRTLTVSQLCGLDLFQAHARNIVPVAAPVISKLDVERGWYFSNIVTRADLGSQVEKTVAINDHWSHSGHTAILEWLAANRPETKFSTIVTGGHARSADALRAGRADVAAIDALSWEFLDTRGLTIVGTSAPAPAPPFVVGVDSDVPRDLLAVALDAAFQRHGEPMGVRAAVPVCLGRYRDVALRAERVGIASDG